MYKMSKEQHNLPHPLSTEECVRSEEQAMRRNVPNLLGQSKCSWRHAGRISPQRKTKNLLFSGGVIVRWAWFRSRTFECHVSKTFDFTPNVTYIGNYSEILTTPDYTRFFIRICFIRNYMWISKCSARCSVHALFIRKLIVLLHAFFYKKVFERKMIIV